MADQRAVFFERRPAATTRAIIVVTPFPGELDTGGLVVRRLAAVHPSLHGDETEAACQIPAEFDERGTNEVESLTIPEIHFRYLPLTSHDHRSPLRQLAAILP